MVRKKVKLQWIANDSARRTTYRKRMKGLMKKVNELSILCGVDACVVAYGPYDPHPEVWPSPWQAACIVKELKNKPEMEQSRKMVNQEDFTRHRIARARDQLLKLQVKNHTLHMEQLTSSCLLRSDNNILMTGATDELQDLICFVGDRLKFIDRRINELSSSTTRKTPQEMAIEALENQVFSTTGDAVLPSTPGHAHFAGYGGGREVTLPYEHFWTN